MVSICCITYNQEKYISKTIEGFLMQKTNFDFEIIIGEDSSTDNTRKICEEYFKKYPDRITLLPLQKNYGMLPNFFRTLKACSGKYIALCEGDDYWINSFKLQTQFDYLESSPNVGMVCTNYNAFFEESKKMIYNYKSKWKNGIIDYDDYILDRSSIGTATVMLRNVILSEYLKKIDPFSKALNIVGDTPIYLYFAKFSKIKYLNISTAVYRKNITSACRFTDVHSKYKFRIDGYKIPFFL